MMLRWWEDVGHPSSVIHVVMFTDSSFSFSFVSSVSEVTSVSTTLLLYRNRYPKVSFLFLLTSPTYVKLF